MRRYQLACGKAASGFEPLHRGFADLSLSHLGTPPALAFGSLSKPATRAQRVCCTLEGEKVAAKAQATLQANGSFSNEKG